MRRREESGEFRMEPVPCANPTMARYRRQEIDALAVARRQMVSVWEWWQGCWLLPVGREIFKTEECSYNRHRSWGSESILPVMQPPVRRRRGSTTCAACVDRRWRDAGSLCARSEEAPLGSYSWVLGPVAYRVRGRDAMADRAAQLVGRARKWLGQDRGIHVGTPLGDAGAVSPERLQGCRPKRAGRNASTFSRTSSGDGLVRRSASSTVTGMASRRLGARCRIG
jgi:hypothetical protein